MKTRILQSKWLIIRIVYVATGIVQGLRFSPSETPLGGPPIWLTMMFPIIVMPILYIVVVKMNTKNGLLDKKWYPPQWRRNPLTFTQPFQLPHLIAWQAIVASIVAFLRLLWDGSVIVNQASLGLSFGVGILLGIRIIMNTHQDRMISDKQM